MIAKFVIVFWSVLNLLLFWHLSSGDSHGTALYLVLCTFIWGIVVVPTAAVGSLFKSRNEQPPTREQRNRQSLILGGAGVLAAFLAYSAWYSPDSPAKTKSTSTTSTTSRTSTRSASTPYGTYRDSDGNQQPCLPGWNFCK